MTDLFLKIFNMSITASWLILAVVLLRLLLKKAPKWISLLLWGMVAVRLLFPISLESILSLIPSAQVISPDIMTNAVPEIHTGISSANAVINPMIADSFTPDPSASANPLQIWIPIAAAVWILGAAVMALCAIISYWRLHRRIRTAIRCTDNIYRSEKVGSPFVLGLVKPRIYLPAAMSEQDIPHVIAHEQAHIARKDHWWKPLGFALLTVYWFHPLVWLAYILLCRDIEFACDEKVIRQLGTDQRADYSQALLSCSIKQKTISACPLAFGEVSIRERVESVLNYKKPTFWILLTAIIACIITAVCFLTNPKEDAPTLSDLPSDYTLEQAKLDGCVVMEDGDVTSGQEIWKSFYQSTRSGHAASVRYVTYFTLGDPEHYAPEYYKSTKDSYPRMYVHDLTYDGKTYTVRWCENGEEIVRSYQYLMLYTGKANSSTAVFQSYTRYVLTNDNTVTWEDIFNGMISSQSGNQIDHCSVYTDLIYPNDPSISDLEKAKTALEPYMNEYQIATLDANEATGTVDITVREMVDGLEELVAQYIDLKYVRIFLLEGELRLTN